jgi:hypothetical protein
MAKPARELLQLHRPSEPARSRPKQHQRAGLIAVSGRKLAAHLDLSLQRVTQLTNVEHVITKLPNGKYDLDACRVAYVRWLRDPERRTARSKADSEFVKAKTALIELRVLEKKRVLIEFEEAMEVAEKIVATTNVALGGLAARVGGSDMNLRRRIDDVVFEVRTEIADQYQAFAEAAAEQASQTEDDDAELSTNDR